MTELAALNPMAYSTDGGAEEMVVGVPTSSPSEMYSVTLEGGNPAGAGAANGDDILAQSMMMVLSSSDQCQMMTQGSSAAAWDDSQRYNSDGYSSGTESNLKQAEHYTNQSW